MAEEGGAADFLTVLGERDGLLLAEALPGVEALFVVRRGQDLAVLRTTGFPGGPR